jgi:two-component system, chemotaxis family, sensor kinase CheA
MLSPTQLIEIFREESGELLANLERILIALGEAPPNQEQLRELFRAAHTLKGNALSLGFAAAAELAHAMEDAFAKGDSVGAAVPALLEAVDALRALAAAEPSATLGDAQRALVTRLREGSPTVRIAATNQVTLHGVARPVMPEEETDRRTRSVRVPVEKLDELMRLVGEVVVARELMKDLLLREDTPRSRRLLSLHYDADRFYDQLQERVIETRLVPVGTLFEQQARVVFDVARAVSKRVRLSTEGADTEVDLAVIEQLRDPILHVVRNAVDHGIEPEDARRACGKPEEGHIRLSAHREGSSIIVEVSDDGKGIDRARVLEKARALGVVPQGAVLDDAEALDLIFAPGLSTAASLTEISGRGVGMDVVRRNVMALGGSVTVTSQKDVGTTLRIRVPLTLGILRGFLVRVAHETYVAPIDGVEECVEVVGAAPGVESGVANLRGEPVPWLRLRRTLAVTREPPGARETLLVLRHETGRVGLLVDFIAGESQLVVRPLGPLLRGVRGVSGTAVLGDGNACLILDAGGLAADASRRAIRHPEIAREPS